MATMTYTEAKTILTKGVIDHPIRDGLSAQKSYDLLILEKSTVRDISIAYDQARNEIAADLKARADSLIKNTAAMTPKQLEAAQVRLLRDAQLYENLETRIAQLGGATDKITAKAILEASGISNEYVQKELQALSFFTNLDPQNFARINTLQAELAVNNVNKATVFVSEAQRKAILPQIQQQIRMGILKGEGIEKITARIVGKTALTLEGVSRFKTLEERARLNARWGIIESASAAATVQYNAFNERCEKAGNDIRVMKQVIAQIDDRTTITCIQANGQIQEVNKPFETDQGELDYPPFHPNCFDKKTEVLTNKGWKLFKDISGNEKILSVNLKNGRSAWIGIKEKIEYRYDGEMVAYTSRNCDLMVTPGHNQVVKFREKLKGRKDAGIWKLVQDKELPNYDFKFLGTIPNYKGVDKEKLKIGETEYNTKDFVEFMGYYLSEGNIDTYTKNKKHYRLKISQNNIENKNKMLKLAEKLFDKIWVCEESFQIPLKNRALVKYIVKLGKSYEKYIPDNIKKLNKKYLRIFLDAYLLGDGHIKKGKLWKDYQFKDMREYYTSSDRMAADIGELILKIGHRPSYYFPKTNKPTKHKNGTYLSKYQCWIIRENTTTSPDKQHLHKKTVNYNDIVYDLELLKYHTLFVRRNGKVLLSGNCRTTVAGWNELFESFGKSTKDMQAESKKQLDKNNALKAKKAKGKTTTKAKVAKQKAADKAGAKALQATTKTTPPTIEAPTKAISDQMKGLSPNEAQRILQIITNTARETALKKLAK